MAKEKNPSRLREILAVAHKHNLARGVSPEKIRLILEDLGPTYIKLGQILSMRSDILPKEICDELILLRSEVTPMPFKEVKEVIEDSYGQSLSEVFQSIETEPIGAASIAQVHKAVLLSGEQVVVKVQRKGIYDIMQSDMDFLHKVIRMTPSINMHGLIDMNKVLDEMWAVAQEEMNFMAEAANMETFAKMNRDVAFVDVPKLYWEHTTRQVLVMELIEGFEVTDAKGLEADGYDLEEIGTKMADSFFKQVLEDGFFHADPHPGNLRIRDGKIVWIDMGMMGRFTQHDQAQLMKAVRGVATHDPSSIVEAVLSLGEFHERPNQKQLYSDISDWMMQYGSAQLGSMNMGSVLQDVLDIMKRNKVSIPQSLTMLVRALTTIEGVVAELSPGISLVDVAAARMAESRFENFDLKKELKENGQELYSAFHKSMKIPGYISDMLHSYMNGQTRINLDLHSTEDLANLLTNITRSLVLVLLVVALLISSSIICMTNMNPKILGIPALGALGYFLALMLTIVILINHFQTRNRR